MDLAFWGIHAVVVFVQDMNEPWNPVPVTRLEIALQENQ